MPVKPKAKSIVFTDGDVSLKIPRKIDPGDRSNIAIVSQIEHVENEAMSYVIKHVNLRQNENEKKTTRVPSRIDGYAYLVSAISLISSLLITLVQK